MGSWTVHGKERLKRYIPKADASKVKKKRTERSMNTSEVREREKE